MRDARRELRRRLAERKAAEAAGDPDRVRDLDGRIGELRTHLSEPRPTLLLGIDPATGRSGWAVWDGAAYRFGVVDGIGTLEATGVLETLDRAYPGARVIALVEYPTWRGPGTAQVRVSANAWIRYIKRVFARRNRISKVGPQAWMGPMGFMRRDGTKPWVRYTPWAEGVVDVPPGLDPNAAAAVCLVEYARRMAEAGR